MNQLDLLNYEPEPVENPLPPPKRQPSPSTLWEMAKADVYLHTMNQIAGSEELSAEVKRQEIFRLHQLRQEALAKLPPAPTPAPTPD